MGFRSDEPFILRINACTINNSGTFRPQRADRKISILCQSTIIIPKTNPRMQDDLLAILKLATETKKTGQLWVIVSLKSSSTSLLHPWRYQSVCLTTFRTIFRLINTHYGSVRRLIVTFFSDDTVAFYSRSRVSRFQNFGWTLGWPHFSCAKMPGHSWYTIQ